MNLGEFYLPHAGWLRHAAEDEVVKFLTRGWFEYREQAFLWLYLRPGDTFLDCGAHVGLFSVIAGQAMKKRGTILAVEPHPETGPLLEQNLQANRIRCGRVRRCALASRPGSVALHLGAEGRAAYSSLYSASALMPEAQVEAITLDALLAAEGIHSVDLAKIDVEGAELEVLSGAAESIRLGRLPLLLVECTEANLQYSGASTQSLFDALSEMGYVVCRFEAENRRLVPRPYEGPIGYDNLFAARHLREVNERLAEASESAGRIARDIVVRGEVCEASHRMEAEVHKALESAERATLVSDEAFRALTEANWHLEETAKQAAASEKRASEARLQVQESERRAEESRKRTDEAARQIDEAFRHLGEANWRAEQAEKRAEAAELRAAEAREQAQLSERRAEESRKRIDQALLQVDEVFRDLGEANWRAEQAEKRAGAAELRAAEARAQAQVSERRAEESRQRAESAAQAALPAPAPASDETEMMRALRHLHERRFRPRVVLDIGAGKGYWSILGSAYFPDAEFYMIEPLTENEPDLRDLCQKDPRWHCLLTAVAKEPGSRVLNIGEQLDSSTLLSFPGADPSRQRPVAATTVDQLIGEGCIPPPDLVRIDVQGMESEVLQGSQALFDSTEVFIVQVNLFEFMPQCPRVHEIIQYMMQHGYYLFDVAGMLRRPYNNDLAQLNLVMASARSPLVASNRWE